MAAIPTCRAIGSRRTSIPPSELILPFLAPSFQRSATVPYGAVSRFSTSQALHKRDNNKNRGVSILRHTGLRARQKLSIQLKDLPKPRSQREPVEGNPNHGLYGFFKDKKLMQTPREEAAHGKSWTIQQLRQKSWDDLHLLWWVCVKERNRLATQSIVHERLRAGYGETEYEERDRTIQETMKAIQHTLIERQSAWEDAYVLASDDPQIDLSGEGPVYDEYATGNLDPYTVEDLETPEEPSQKVVEEIQEPEWKQKDLPAPNFFNTPENPPTLVEKAKQKTTKLLWNK